MGFIEDLKKEAIKDAKRKDCIHYVARHVKTHKYIQQPIHQDLLIDWVGDNVEITFIAFPHSVVSNVVMTKNNKSRMETEEKRYKEYYVKYGRSHKMNWLKYNSENVVEDKV